MERCFIFLGLFLLSLFAGANEQQSAIFWIQLTDKNDTPYSLSQPGMYLSARAIERKARHQVAIDSTDLPVNTAYVDSLTKLGFTIKHTSRWLNGVIASLPSEKQIDSIQMPSFVRGHELRKTALMKSTSNKLDRLLDSLAAIQYGNSYSQVSIMNGHILNQYSRGEGTHIAVIDAGFLNANQHKAFKQLYQRGGVLGTYDFVKPGNNVYDEHSHGIMVLSTMAANSPGELVGTAPDASYWLLRSEDGASEYPVEEDYWIVAVEFADSVGCDVVNTSLGYYKFDDPSMDHSPAMYNGKTLRISQAANMAVEKGMVLVCSAGNEGTTPWVHIVAPAEAEKVLSVAAVDSKGTITRFSSRGFGEQAFPPKPDVSAMGTGVWVATGSGGYTLNSGTSFSAPLVAGMAASLVSLFPKLTATEIMQMIKSHSDRFDQHDSLYGYGIPDFGQMVSQLSNTSANKQLNQTFKVWPNPFVNRITFELKGPTETILVFNTNGILVHQVNIPDQSDEIIFTENLSKLPKGVYFALFRQKHKVQTIKLIKQ